MSCEELIELIKAWIEDVDVGELTTGAFIKVVKSLLEVYERGE